MAAGPLFLSLVGIAGLTTSLPLATHNPEPVYAYFPNPTGRGTVGLVYTCLLTLTLCLWTAMHPDVPFSRGRWLCGPAYKGTWMLWAIITPEFLVCCAISQFLEARALCRDWEAYWERRGDAMRQKWLGLEGAFLFVMGGYEISCAERLSLGPDSLPLEDKTAQETRSTGAVRSAACRCGPAIDCGQPVRRTLTSGGLRSLLALQDGSVFSGLVSSGVLNKTHFDPRHVRDKGKANYAAKLLTAAQMLWIVLQWIARKADGLPITLLEVHVLIQIPYTLIAYFFWWFKPLDVGMPIVLPICNRLPAEFDEWRLSESQPCSGLGRRDSGPLRHKQLIRIRRANPSVLSVMHRAIYDFMWHFNGRAQLGASLMAVINGCLHATAWVSYFPTPAERTLWRVACFGVGAAPMAMYAVVWGKHLECLALQFLYRLATRDTVTLEAFVNEFAAAWTLIVVETTRGDASPGNENGVVGFSKSTPTWCRHLVLAVVVFSWVVYWTFILLFLVEAFISLRSIPESVYRTVAWTNYLPHF